MIPVKKLIDWMAQCGWQYRGYVAKDGVRRYQFHNPNGIIQTQEYTLAGLRRAHRKGW